jgi:DNA sulfur modification protein DndB
MMDTRFGYTFPAIRGIQARREYFTSMCPLRLMPKIFLFDEDEAALAPELKAQRTLNRNRIPELSNYILDNLEDYAFSSITASIDANVEFEPIGDDANTSRIGLLHVPMDARFIINDGQHRRAAIEIALKENPDLGDESIAVVFYVDRGLERCQQLFADLNRYAVRPSRSIGVLYDHRDDLAQIARLVVLKSPVFKDLTEMERSSLSKRSRKLFTLSAIFNATNALLSKKQFENVEDAANVAIAYWEEVSKQFPEWLMVRERKVSSGEIRQDYIHPHSIALHSLGRIGNHLLSHAPKSWKAYVAKLKEIDWSRDNAKMWEGRAIVGGRLSKANQNVLLTAAAIKQYLELPLTPDEERMEIAIRKASSG